MGQARLWPLWPQAGTKEAQSAGQGTGATEGTATLSGHFKGLWKYSEVEGTLFKILKGTFEQLSLESRFWVPRYIIWVPRQIVGMGLRCDILITVKWNPLSGRDIVERSSYQYTDEDQHQGYYRLQAIAKA